MLIARSHFKQSLSSISVFWTWCFAAQYAPHSFVVMDINLLLLIYSSSTSQSLSVHVTSVFTSIFRWSLLCVHQAWASGCGRRHYPMELSSCPSCAKGCSSCSVWQCCHCKTSWANTIDSSLFWLIDHRGVFRLQVWCSDDITHLSCFPGCIFVLWILKGDWLSLAFFLP